MRLIVNGWLALAAVFVVSTNASAQLFPPRNCAPIVPLDCPPGTPGMTTPPNANPNPNVPNPEGMAQENALNNAFAQGNEGGGNAARTFNDTFNGDFGGRPVRYPVLVGEDVQVFGISPSQTIVRTPIYRDIIVPLGTRYNGILITDNDSPRPVDRFYFGYNYYNGLGAGQNGGFERVDMHRQTIGFEKTFFGGDASFGMRLPFIQITGGPPGIAQSNTGDLTLLFKYAFVNDRTTGNVTSAGLVVTTPTGTGNNFLLPDGTRNPTDVILQPWLGTVRMFESGYVQGITSFLIPANNREPLLFNNSAAVGYFLYQNATDRFINAVVPTLEAHVRTPLNHRSTNDPIFFQDQVNLTAAVNLRTTRATVSPAICIPLVAPQVYNAEFNLMVNVRF